MHRTSFAVAALLLASPAFAQSQPTKGTFGLGATITGAPLATTAFQALVLQPGIQGSYFVDDRVRLDGNFGVTTIENGPTFFTIVGGVDYFLVKNLRDSYGVFIGGSFGISSASQAGQSNTSILFNAGAGIEYYFTRHFATQLRSGLQLSTNPTTFTFAPQISLNWYL